MKNRDKLLGVAAIITFLMGIPNAVEYFFANKGYLDNRKGVVEKVVHENYDGSRGILYSKTTIRLNNVKKEFYLSDKANDGGFIDVADGDLIIIFTKKTYQFLYNFNGGGNIYYVEKAGMEPYDDLKRWKAGALYYMCLFGGCSLLLFVMYLDQVKNISIANWFQKRFVKNKEIKS